MLAVFVLPACFLAAGLIGLRLGTPVRVAAGLLWIGTAHLVAFSGALLATHLEGGSADAVFVPSQLLFLGAFAGFIWLAAAYPDGRPSRRLVGVTSAAVVVAQVMAAVSGPTSIMEDHEFGPLVHWLPASAAASVDMAIPVLMVSAMVIFIARYRRATRDDRSAMRWPIAGVVAIAVLALAGTSLGPSRQLEVTVLFLLTAPIFPLSVAFGPVIRRMDLLAADVEELTRKLHLRPPRPPGELEVLTPRELTVLEAMAHGMSNPEIARTMHLSLSSVEKHVTSIFRKLDLPEGPETHRRVAAVVAYRDACG